jgi:putative endonuclease
MPIDPCVYILCNCHRNVLYVGATDDLRKRIYFHKKRLIGGFTKKYNVDRLVYYESFEDSEQALEREKKLKRYKREKKIQLIEKFNPDWNDLYESNNG